MKSGVAKHILILQVSPIAPAEDAEGDRIRLPRLDEWGDVKLHLQSPVLRVAHEVAIHPDIGAGADRPDIERDILPAPVCRHHDLTAVGADDIVLIGYRLLGERLILEVSAPGIADIEVHRIADAILLPQSRYRHRAPVAVVEVRLHKVGRVSLDISGGGKLPLALE